MKALCVRSPFSSLIMEGMKDVENRSWKTKYRGEIAIVNSGGKIEIEDYASSIAPFIKLSKFLYKFKYKPPWPQSKLVLDAIKFIDNYVQPQRGEVLGTVEIIDIVRDSNSFYADPDSYNWILANPKKFNRKNLKKRIVKGKLRFFDI